MSEICATGSSLISSIASLASAESLTQLKEVVAIRVLADTLDFQKTFAAELLQSLGRGQNVDLEI